MARITYKTNTQNQNNKEIKYLKREEWQQLIESIDNYRDKLIVKLLYSTGTRVGELAKLKVEDIDFQERFIRIPQKTLKLTLPGPLL
ncbi:tyrosine-type recombinase/integrase [bacterium]|nr:tyrosine-type recombinase/integrase [bacterium]MCK4437000.1 tyrosine-type recombinase/integrase [bacterium]